MVLQVVYWVLILLAIAGCFVPEPYLKFARGLDLVLFVILGLAVWGMPK